MSELLKPMTEERTSGTQEEQKVILQGVELKGRFERQLSDNLLL